MNKQRKKPLKGPAPERLKLAVDWETAIRQSFRKKRPATGWPKFDGLVKK
jgi:hypothetical protein